MNDKLYMPWAAQARLIKARMQKPLNWNGETFTPTITAAKELGIRPHVLHLLARQHPARNEVIATANGVRFIRASRDRTDLRPPLYWDLESLRKAYT